MRRGRECNRAHVRVSAQIINVPMRDFVLIQVPRKPRPQSARSERAAHIHISALRKMKRPEFSNAQIFFARQMQQERVGAAIRRQVVNVKNF